ncbi:heme ABC transporter ATP-binding protein [Arhodomonas sp. AD133]|uniref:heme ABC transporter ATP-binding protein n=1 Tax=Arhodomonas sp. AD133 TaxID=3415009 RepID=UPI003EBB8905
MVGFTVEAASVVRGGRYALDGVSLQLSAGEVVVVLGPNGAGKSTLLGLLAGEARPDAGCVTLDGRPLAEIHPRTQAQRRAVLPQQTPLGFPLRVEEVVALGRDPHHRDPERGCDREAIVTAMAHAGVAHLQGRQYDRLSGGERQRVQLARALAQVWLPSAKQPRYLLLDEPTASLDIRHQHEVLGLCRRLAREGLGVFCVLHDLNLAAGYADRVCLLAQGQVVADGPPAAVMTPASLQVVFGISADVAPDPRDGRPRIGCHRAVAG